MRLKIRSGKYSAEIYYVDASSGKRVRRLRATGIFADGSVQAKRTAETIGRQLEANAAGLGGSARAREVRRKGATTFRAAVAARISKKRLEGCSDEAIKLAFQKIEHALRFFGPETDPWLITEERLNEYAIYARSKRAVATVERELMEVRAALKAAGVKPLPDTPRLGRVKPRELWLNPEKSARVFELLPARCRDHAIVYRLLGLSASELYKLGEIDWELGTVRVHGTKRETRDRTLVAPAQALEILKRHSGRLPRIDTTAMNKALTRAARRAGVVGPKEWVSTNVLRASFCSELVLAGTPAIMIARMMGHSTTKTVERWYARLRGAEDFAGRLDVLATYDVANTSQHSRRSADATDVNSRSKPGKSTV